MNKLNTYTPNKTSIKNIGAYITYLTMNLKTISLNSTQLLKNIKKDNNCQKYGTDSRQTHPGVS